MRELIWLKKAGKTDEEVADALKASEHLYPYAAKTVWRIWREFQEGKHQGLDTASDSDSHRTTVNDENDLTSESDSDTHRDTPSEGEVLEAMKTMLDQIETDPRPQGATAPGRKAPWKTRSVAVRLPDHVVEKLESLPGTKSSNIEKAVKLYLQILESGGEHE